MPDFLARDAITEGVLCTLLNGVVTQTGQFSLVWPSSRHLSPKLRAFADFCAVILFIGRPLVTGAKPRALRLVQPVSGQGLAGA